MFPVICAYTPLPLLIMERGRGARVGGMYEDEFGLGLGAFGSGGGRWPGVAGLRGLVLQ